MQDDRCVPKAQSFQRSNLFALSIDEPTENDIQQKCSDAEEDRRDHNAQGLLFGQFVLQKSVRGEFAAVEGANATVRSEQPVDLLNDARLRGLGFDGKHHIVECTTHIEGAGHRILACPENDEIAIVRERQSRACGEDELWRQRDADDPERLQAAVEDNVDTISGAHRSSFGIGLVDYDFIGAGWID